MRRFMGDAGEGLIDAEARLQERMDELEEARKVAKDRGPKVDPEYVRQVESLRLAESNCNARRKRRRMQPARTRSVRRSRKSNAAWLR